MTNNIKKWVDKNIIGAEFDKSTEGKSIIFVPTANNQDQKTLKYLNRIKASFKADYRANYNWLCIIFK